MRPEIPGPLSERVNAVADQGGYASGSELVRDAVRQQLNRLEGRVSTEEIKHWLDREPKIEMVTEETFPRAEYDIDTEETSIIEEADWTLLVRFSEYPIWIHRGMNWEPINIEAKIDIEYISLEKQEMLTNCPGYVIRLNKNNNPANQLEDSKYILLGKRFQQEALTQDELQNTLLTIGGSLQFATGPDVTFQDLLPGED